MSDKNDMTADETQRHTFIKSSFCQDGGCVEIARDDNGDVMVRDGKNPAQPVLTFDKAEWAAFVKGVKNGEFEVQA